MNTKRKNALFGRYPSCDMLNNALRFIRDGKIDAACSEIVFAIEKADGYFHEDIVPIVEKVKWHWVKTHSNRYVDDEEIFGKEEHWQNDALKQEDIWNK